MVQLDFDIACFDRSLILLVKENEKDAAITILNFAYDFWREYPNFVGDKCCEEYMLEVLKSHEIEHEVISYG